MHSFKLTDWLAWFFFFAVLVITWKVYQPGLHGFYLFDDLPNLSFLGQYKAGLALNGWLVQLTSGIASSIGRPVAVFSFMLQSGSWPTAPGDFRTVNVFLHMLNGCLLASLAYRILILTHVESGRARIMAIIAASWWLLLPILVSTVLYIVQRMAELSALFVLLAMNGYVYGRYIAARSLGPGYIWMTASLILGGSLAVLSKENGVLLLGLVLALEATVFSSLQKPQYFPAWKTLMLWVPIGLGIIYIVIHWQWVLSGYAVRDFTLEQRMLTEPRILMDYLLKIFLPSAHGFAFYYDDYPVSSGLLNPYSTLVAIVCLLGLIGWAVRYRHVVPWASLAILWFFIGHSMESTILPLELYFEHRNYLPSMGLALALGHYSVAGWYRFTGRRHVQITLAGLAITYLVLVTSITFSNAQLRGDSLRQAAVWVVEHPNSARNKMRLAEMLRNAGRYDEAATLSKQIAHEHSGNIDGYFFWLTLGCVPGNPVLPDYQEIYLRSKTAGWSPLPTEVGDALFKQIKQGGCPRLNPSELRRIFEGLLGNPKYLQSQANLYLLIGNFYSLEHNLDGAILSLDAIHALKGKPRPDVALQQASWLMGGKLYDDALKYIELSKRLNSMLNPARQLEYGDAILNLEKKIISYKQQSTTKDTYK